MLHESSSRPLFTFGSWVGIILLFLLILFSELGCILFLSLISNQNLVDPLNNFHFLPPTFQQTLFWFVFVCFVFQSIANVLGVLDMKKKIHDFSQELTESIEKLNQISCVCVFIIHLVFTVIFYVTNASLPWVGLHLYGMNIPNRNLLGAIMFLGQIVLYCLSYIDAIFSTPHQLLAANWKSISYHALYPFTLDKNCWIFRIRTLTQVLTEAWFSFEVGILLQNILFFNSWILYLISISAAYHTLIGQGPIKDYQQRFLHVIEDVPSDIKYWKTFFIHLVLLPVWISHTLSVISLFTQTLLIRLIGFLLGGYAAHQYTYDYLYYLVKQGLTF